MTGVKVERRLQQHRKLTRGFRVAASGHSQFLISVAQRDDGGGDALRVTRI